MTRTWRHWLALLPMALVLSPWSSPAGGKGGKKFDLVYVPTDEKVVEKMFDLAKIKKDDVVFDLGCGDGRIVAMACKKFGVRGVGIDLSPECIRDCMDTIKKYQVEAYVDKGLLEYRLGNALMVPDLDKATVVMLYMLPEFMDLLEPIARRTLKPGCRIVAHAYRWRSKEWEPDQTVHVKSPGGGLEATLYLWTVKEKK